MNPTVYRSKAQARYVLAHIRFRTQHLIVRIEQSPDEDLRFRLGEALLRLYQAGGSLAGWLACPVNDCP